MKYLLGVFVVLCSMFFVPFRELRQVQEVFYQIGGIAFICSFFMFFHNNRTPRNLINIFIGIFVAYSSILLMLNGFQIGSNVFFNIFTGAMLYYSTLQLKKTDTEFILKIIIGICCLNMVYIGIQNCGWDFIYSIRGANGPLEGGIDLIGLFALKSIMGIWMGLGLLATLVFSPILAIAFLVPIYIAKSSGVVLGITVSSLFYFYYINSRLFKKLIYMVIAGSLLYIVFVDSPMGMMGTRPPMWKTVLKDTIYGVGGGSRFLHNPILGFGLDSFRNDTIRYFRNLDTNKTERIVKVQDYWVNESGKKILVINSALKSEDNQSYDYWDNPHNEFIQLFREMGIIGFLIITAIIILISVKFRNSIKDEYTVCLMSMLIFLLITGLTQFPFHLARIGFMLPVITGLLMVNFKE